MNEEIVEFHKPEDIPENIVSIDDRFIVKEVLSNQGNASGKVFLVVEGTRWYAAKILTRRRDFITQVAFLNEVRGNQNVACIHYSNEGATSILQQKNNERTVIRVPAIIIEFSQHGDLFDFIADGLNYYKNTCFFSLPIKVAKGLFHQLLQGVKYIHDKGILHRDLKSQNLLLDQHFKLKIIDFGWATKIDQTQLKGKRPGTQRYLAPEALKGIKFCQRSQFFTCGIIFYFICFTHYPFPDSSPNDKYKKFSYQKQSNQSSQNGVWKNIEKYTQKQIPGEVKQLFSKIFLLDIDRRLNMQDVLESGFFQGMATPQQVENFMKSEYSSFSLEKGKVAKILELKQQLEKLSSQQKNQLNQMQPEEEARSAKISSEYLGIKNFYETNPTNKNDLKISLNIHQKLAFRSNISFIVSWLNFYFYRLFNQKDSIVMKILFNYKIQSKNFQFKNNNMISIRLILNSLEENEERQQMQQEHFDNPRTQQVLEGSLLYRQSDDRIIIEWNKKVGDEFILEMIVRQMKQAMTALVEYEKQQKL